jgi:hypothetical protein
MLLRGVAVKLELDGYEPLQLQLVQLMYRDTANLGPGTVYEGVVVEELAAEHKRDGEETEQMSVGLWLVS